MMVELLLFARFREHLGADRTSIELAQGQTIADLRQTLQARWPALESLLGNTLFAVGNEYVADSRTLTDHETVALIPPVSGG